MIPGGLINAWFKTERAKKHLNDLDEALGQYFDADKKPYSVSVENDRQHATFTLRVEIEEPHVWLFLIAGDVFSCLRSALDHAIWRIASLHVAEPKENIQFPVIALDDKRGRKLFQKQTAGLPDEVVAVIESLQPYRRLAGTTLTSHELWCLNKMANVDKHRRIAVHPTVAVTSWGVPPTSVIEGDGRRTFLFSLPAHSKMIGNPEVRIEVIFGSEADGVGLTLADIHLIHEFVARTVLVSLARFDP